MIPTLARRLFLAALMTAPLAACAGQGLMNGASAGAIQQAAFERTATGIVVTPAEGAARRVRLEVYGPETIRVTQQTSRSQWRNRQLCIAQATDMIDTAAAPPAPPRRPSRPSRGAIERRLTSKKRESEKKDQRRKGDWE